MEGGREKDSVGLSTVLTFLLFHPVCMLFV